MKAFRPFKPYRDRPLCFLDVEGTGTKSGYHEITEIGLRHENKGGLCLQIAPKYIERAEPEALRVSRYNSSDWAEAPIFTKALPKFLGYIEDSTIVGHNILGYDIPMMRGEFEMNGLEHGHLFRDAIDTMMLARMFLVPLGLNRIGLGSCMKFIGEEYDDAHSAYSDVLYCEKLYRYIESNMKWHGTRDGKRIQESLF
jgi:DNA polymerase III alpha subunit (gram-positive type)